MGFEDLLFNRKTLFSMFLYGGLEQTTSITSITTFFFHSWLLLGGKYIKKYWLKELIGTFEQDSLIQLTVPQCCK